MAKRHMSIIDASKTLISKENAKLQLRCRLRTIQVGQNVTEMG